MDGMRNRTWMSMSICVLFMCVFVSVESLKIEELRRVVDGGIRVNYVVLKTNHILFSNAIMSGIDEDVVGICFIDNSLYPGIKFWLSDQFRLIL